MNILNENKKAFTECIEKDLRYHGKFYILYYIKEEDKTCSKISNFDSGYFHKVRYEDILEIKKTAAFFINEISYLPEYQILKTDKVENILQELSSYFLNQYFGFIDFDADYDVDNIFAFNALNDIFDKCIRNDFVFYYNFKNKSIDLVAYDGISRDVNPEYYGEN